MSFEDRLELLVAVKNTLEAERTFYLKARDWPKVSIRKQRIKVAEEQIASLKARKGK